MPKVEFPYDKDGMAAARKAVGLHPKAKMISDSSYGGKGGSRKKPRRADDVPSGNKMY